MIKEFDFYHGVVFSRLFHEIEGAITIRTYPSIDNASYVLNEEIGVYIKYSSKRMAPWRFSFLKKHQDEILEMRSKLKNVCVLLVCGDDGIVTLDHVDLKKILDEVHGNEWISVKRNKRQMYSVKGSDGSLEFKIGRNEFPFKIFRSEAGKAGLQANLENISKLEAR